MLFIKVLKFKKFSTPKKGNDEGLHYRSFAKEENKSCFSQNLKQRWNGVLYSNTFQSFETSWRIGLRSFNWFQTLSICTGQNVFFNHWFKLIRVFQCSLWHPNTNLILKKWLNCIPCSKSRKTNTFSLSWMLQQLNQTWNLHACCDHQKKRTFKKDFHEISYQLCKNGEIGPINLHQFQEQRKYFKWNSLKQLKAPFQLPFLG